MEFPLLEACQPAYTFVDIDIIMPVCNADFFRFLVMFCRILLINLTELFSNKLFMCHLYSIINIMWILDSRLVFFQHLESLQSFPL